MGENLVDNRGLEEGLFRTIVKTVQEMPALKNMKITLRQIAPGKAGFEMLIDPGYSNSRGTAHGGLIASFADTAMGYAGISLDLMLVTLEMNLNYFASVKVGERIFADAEVVHNGRTTVVAEAKIYDSGNRIISKSRGTYFPVGKISEMGSNLIEL